MIHQEKHKLAGQIVILKTKPMRLGVDPDNLNGAEFIIEDWWDRVSGISWMHANGNPACMKYGIRGGCAGLPIDNEVVYGKVGGLGHLVHNSEIKSEDTISESRRNVDGRD